MKTKKLSKKLNLRKITIANLGNGKMSAIYGGATIFMTGCDVCTTEACEPHTFAMTSCRPCPPSVTVCGVDCPE